MFPPYTTEMGNKWPSYKPHDPDIHPKFGQNLKNIESMDLEDFVPFKLFRNWHSTSIFYPPNGEIINKWETIANPNGPTSQLCTPTFDQGSSTFSRWIHRNLFHQIPSGTRVPPPYSSPTMQMVNLRKLHLIALLTAKHFEFSKSELTSAFSASCLIMYHILRIFLHVLGRICHARDPQSQILL